VRRRNSIGFHDKCKCFFPGYIPGLEKPGSAYQEYRGRQNRCKTRVFLDNRRLGDVGRPDDLAADAENFLFFIPAFIFIKILNTQG